MLLFKGIIPDPQDESTKETGKKSSEKSSEKILRLIKENNKISAGELSDKIGISPRAVEKQISKLKSEGYLKRVGPNKGGHWEVLKCT